MNNKSNVKNPSEGEQYIADWLHDMDFEFETEKRIAGLKYDSKQYRDADFYLPNYDVYIEFLGMWNSGETFREEYRKKKKVYAQNNIPCVYIYPENLGYVDMLLDYRLNKVFEKYGMNKSKKRMITREIGGRIVIPLWLILIGGFGSKIPFYGFVILLFAGILWLIYEIYQIIKGYQGVK